MTSAPDIVFRVDASIEIGTGHVMRCLTLADALRGEGARCRFLCRPHPGHLAELIHGKGHSVTLLSPPHPDAGDGSLSHSHWLGAGMEEDAAETRAALTGAADWLVVDHYALDARWEKTLRPMARRLMAIDDLADRAHDCDLLLDPGLGRTGADYASLLPDGARMLLGPGHALLRPEFAACRAESLARRKEPALRHILVTMGGVDKGNATGDILDALAGSPLPDDVRITVVMGGQAPWLAEVVRKAAAMPRTTGVLTDVRDMARLMADSDLAIGAAGSTSWERCCMGLPTFQVVLAENQKLMAARLADVGATIDLGPIGGLAVKLPTAFAELTTHQLRALSDNGSEICDGHGAMIVTERMRAMEVKGYPYE